MFVWYDRLKRNRKQVIVDFFNNEIKRIEFYRLIPAESESFALRITSTEGG